MESKKELQMPGPLVAKRNTEELGERTGKREIRKPRKTEQKKNYKPQNKPSNINKLKRILLIASVSASLGVSAIAGISIYNNQQTTRKAVSYEKQITDYNKELYNKVQNLKEDGLSELSNDELISLIDEVNKNNYYAIKDKIANVMPDDFGKFALIRHDSQESGYKYGKTYIENDNREYLIDDSRILKIVDRYTSVEDMIEKTKYGDIDRSKLEKELFELADETEENANIGFYIDAKDAEMRDGALKTYKISKSKDKIEKKLAEINENDKNFDMER